MKLTPEHIENQIASEQYLNSIDTGAALGTLTICVLTLKNGILITGTSACLDAATFDAQIGKDLARKDAVRQIWQLEGYLHATLSKLEGYKASLVTITVDAKAAMAECKAASDEVKAFCADAVATVTELTKLPNGEQASTICEGYDIGHYYGFRDGYKAAEAKLEGDHYEARKANIRWSVLERLRLGYTYREIGQALNLVEEEVEAYEAAARDELERNTKVGGTE